jgi:uncharacterized protein YjbI with pentapeptide repeats
MPDEYRRTEAFRDATFTEVDLEGAIFRDCNLSKVKIVDSLLSGLYLGGEIENLVVNDVDVTAYVNGELDRRSPERVQVREMKTADEYRAAWETVERLWSETVTRAARLPEPVRLVQVDGEWSFVETLRHLIFAADAWAFRAARGEPSPYHRFGIPHSSTTREQASSVGVDLDAQPSYAEVLDAYNDRLAQVRAIVADLTDADLDRECPDPPAPWYPDATRTVGRCLRVVMREAVEHRRYAERDLAVLETAPR